MGRNKRDQQLTGVEAGGGVRDQRVSILWEDSPKVPAGRVRQATCYPAHLCSFNSLSSVPRESPHVDRHSFGLPDESCRNLKSIFTACGKVLSLLYFLNCCASHSISESQNNCTGLLVFSWC